MAMTSWGTVGAVSAGVGRARMRESLQTPCLESLWGTHTPFLRNRELSRTQPLSLPWFVSVAYSPCTLPLAASLGPRPKLLATLVSVGLVFNDPVALSSTVSPPSPCH